MKDKCFSEKGFPKAADYASLILVSKISQRRLFE